MSLKQDKIHAVPTNIITGFLGVGKTSAILSFLSQKPEDERWAILVNEFGEIGVDGSLFGGQLPKQSGVFIREVPGGCMCCAAGVPMQVALNSLLVHSKPHRLLIEPTGLGHPQEVLRTLTAEHYQEVLSLQKTLTLVDGRKLTDERYTTHETFNQQILMADTIVGNKMDLYQAGDADRLINYVEQKGQPKAKVVFTQHGDVSLSELHGPTSGFILKSLPHHPNKEEALASDANIPERGYIRAMNAGEGFRSIGWRFSPNKIFNYDHLLNFFNELHVERMKAAVITDKGTFGFNLTQDGLTEIKLDECLESRIEIISLHISKAWEKQLFQCILKQIHFSPTAKGPQ